MRKLITLICLLALAVAPTAFASTLTIRPDAQGTYSSWTNSGCTTGYDCVDEASASTADYVQTGTNNAKETFTFSNSGLEYGADTINSVTLHYYAERVKAQDSCFSPMVRMFGTDYLLGSQICTTSSFGDYSHTYTTTPAFGSEWNVNSVDSLEAGMYALDPNGGGRVAQVYADIDYTLGSCTDTDGGIVPGTQGTVSGTNNNATFNYTDFCNIPSGNSTNTTVTEYYCNSRLASATVVSCASGCTNGACF
jgi:hypothetical protein